MAALSGITGVFAFGAGIVMIFYSLDSLYSERKDKSILFWRSLPITDAETVISKVLTLFIAIPVAALAGAFLTHLASMTISSLWIMVEGGNAMHLIWRPAPLGDAWLSSVIIAFATSIWLSPFFGWFLFVSAYTRRMPLLMGFLPLIVAPLLEIALLPTDFLWSAIRQRFSEMPLKGVTLENVFDGDDWPNIDAADVSIIQLLDVGRFITSPSVWIGVVVCGLFVTAAIYVRRFKDES